MIANDRPIAEKCFHIIANDRPINEKFFHIVANNRPIPEKCFHIIADDRWQYFKRSGDREQSYGNLALTAL